MKTSKWGTRSLQTQRGVQRYESTLDYTKSMNTVDDIRHLQWRRGCGPPLAILSIPDDDSFS